MENIDQLKQFLNSPKKIVITTHCKPDADALGSSLAWAGYLKKYHHQVTVITPTDYPRFLHWMEGNEEVLIYSHKTRTRVQQHFDEADLVCCLDFSACGRVEDMEDILKASEKPTLLVDHHIDPSITPTYNYWDVEAAATAQLIFKLIVALGDKALIDVGMGEAIYAGILTDTGSFKHPSTSKEVHQIAGELIEIGVDTSKTHHLIYDNNTEERLRFLGYLLSEKLTVLPEQHTAYFVVTKEELRRFHSQTGDTEGVVNYALSVEGVVFAAIIIDRGEKVKLSFRSVGDFSVNEFANQYFEGGGHKNAAGGVSYLNLNQTVEKFLQALSEHKQQLTLVH